MILDRYKVVTTEEEDSLVYFEEQRWRREKQKEYFQYENVTCDIGVDVDIIGDEDM